MLEQTFTRIMNSRVNLLTNISELVLQYTDVNVFEKEGYMILFLNLCCCMKTMNILISL